LAFLAEARQGSRPVSVQSCYRSILGECRTLHADGSTRSTITADRAVAEAVGDLFSTLAKQS
jgi:hypothetical protein